MTAGAWWMMALVCGFVWGGFATLLVRALRYERRKGGGER